MRYTIFNSTDTIRSLENLQAQLLEVRNDGDERQVRLLLDRYEESVPVEVLVLGGFVA